MRRRSSRVFLYPSSAAKNKNKMLPSVKRRLVKIRTQGEGKGGARQAMDRSDYVQLAVSSLPTSHPTSPSSAFWLHTFWEELFITLERKSCPSNLPPKSSKKIPGGLMSQLTCLTLPISVPP